MHPFYIKETLFTFSIIMYVFEDVQKWLRYFIKRHTSNCTGKQESDNLKFHVRRVGNNTMISID